MRVSPNPNLGWLAHVGVLDGRDALAADADLVRVRLRVNVRVRVRVRVGVRVGVRVRVRCRPASCGRSARSAAR